MKRDKEQYDIFLSYRRKGGFETAKHIFDLLTRDGYRVSFDIDTLRSGDFDTQLLQRIDECTDFIVILNAGAFDRSIDPTFDRNKDWLRIELAYALEKGKNTIPVMLNGFTEFPNNLPDDIAAVERKNGPKYDHYYFDAFYNKLLRFLESQPIAQEKGLMQQGDSGDSILKIETDLDCYIYIDGEGQGTLQAGKFRRIPLRGGCYRLRFISIKDPTIYIEDENFHIIPNTEEWYSVSLLLIKQQREQEEKEQYLLQLPDDFFILHKEEGKYGFIDNEGKEIIPCIFNGARPFHEGLARVEKERKYGFINKAGKIVIPCIYNFANPFNEKLALVKKEGKYGFIDNEGKEIIPCIFNEAWSFHEGLACVEKEGKCGFIDKNGKNITPYIYDPLPRYKVHPEIQTHKFIDKEKMLIPVRREGKIGLINKVGKEIVPCIYDHAELFNEGLARIIKKGKYGFINKVGKEIIPCIYDHAWSFHEGLAKVKKSKKWSFFDSPPKYGFIGKGGKIVIPCIYDSASSFHNGLAKVKKNGKWGYIDKKGNWVKNA